MIDEITYNEVMNGEKQSLTMTAPKPEPKTDNVKFWQMVKWIWKHRKERNCRQKMRRMDKELSR